MKKYAWSLSFVMCLACLQPSVKAANFIPSDIVLSTRVDFDWSTILVRKLRGAMINNGLADPFKMKIEESIVVSESLIESYLNPSSVSLLTDLGNATGLDLLKGQSKITLHGLAYDIQNFQTSVRTSEEDQTGLKLSAKFQADSAIIQADKVTLGLIVPGKNGDSKIEIDIIKPVIQANHDKLINFLADIKIKDEGDAYKLKVLKTDFANMADELASHPDLVSFSLNRIVVPKVEIKVGNRKLSFDSAKIEKMLTDKKDAIKGLLLVQVSSLLKKGLSQDMLKVTEKISVKKDFWFGTNDMMGRLQIQQITGSSNGENLEVVMPADFCAETKYLIMKNDCVKDPTSLPIYFRSDFNSFLSSMDTMRDLIDNREANLVASVSEEYVNKIISSSLEAGNWASILKEADVTLGPKKAFIRLDERGESGTLFMDIQKAPGKFKGMVIGTQMVKFPLVMKVAIRVENHDKTPTLIITIKEADLSMETLTKGRPDVGMESNIGKLRMKKAVIKEIAKNMAPYLGKDVIELRYPELKGLGLEKIDFLSDGNGRMNALMRIQDLVNEPN